MPITLPKIDDRRYDDLLSEALARIPVHTPEWTNFNRSDPGVTIIEVFAFLTESLLYRANQIPERNRRKFLQLLRIPLRSAIAAQGLIVIGDETRSPAPAPTLVPADLEVRAGKIPFGTTAAVDVLPVEGRIYVKKRIDPPSPDVVDYYKQLYASYRGDAPAVLPELYESVLFPTRDGSPLALEDTIDSTFWLALLVRASDTGLTPDLLRTQIENRTLSLGVVPSLATTSATLPAGRPFASRSTLTFTAEVPKPGDNGGLPDDPARRRAEYRAIETRTSTDVFSVPGVVEIALPTASAMTLWNNLDPLEAGVDDLPPSIDDPAVEARVITWIRVRPSAATDSSFLWMGINAVPVSQREHVANELLPNGNGEPDQIVQLAQSRVLPESVEIVVTPPFGDGAATWTRVDDLSTAPPEVPLPDPTVPAGAARMPVDRNASKVFLLNAESGEVRFGDGIRGARPPDGATIRASYDYAVGAAGNVGAGDRKSVV